MMDLIQRDEQGYIRLERADYTIHSYHTDLKQQAGLPALFSFMQESAWHHAELNNFGWEALTPRNLIWALARMQVKVHQYPAWKDTVILETWSKLPEPLMAYRDFELRNSKGDLLLSATSAWLVIEATTRRPQRIAILGDCFPVIEGREAISGSLQRITQAPAPQNNTLHTVPYSAIDINGHVNNVCYVQWVIDAFPCDYLLHHNITEIEINYLQESRMGDQYQINIQELQANKYVCNIVRHDNGKELVRMVVQFEGK